MYVKLDEYYLINTWISTCITIEYNYLYTTI